MSTDATRETPGLMERVRQFIADDQKKIGGMTPSAMFRLGLAELREAASFGGNVTQPTPYGMYGTMTPGQVGEAQTADPAVRQMDEEPHVNDKQNQPTPGQIIDNPAAYQPERQGQQHGHAMGQEQGQGSVHGNGGPSPTPGQIIDNPAAYSPEQNHGQEHEQQHDHGRGM